MIDAVDGRIQFQDTMQRPYSFHGLVSYRNGNMNCWGTGTLIGPNVILTAGHHLYNHHRQSYTDLERLQFMQGINGQVLPFGMIEVEKYFVSPNFIKEEKEDYGILILKKPIGEQIQKWKTEE